MRHRGCVVGGRWAVAGMLGAIALFAAPLVEAQHWGRPSEPRTGACFYRDKDFEGDYFCESAGASIGALPSGINDQISSVRTFGGAEVTLYRNTRFGGESTELRGEVRNLRDEGWNDRISSLQVRGGYRSGGRGNGYSSGGRNSDADVIVRRAYDDVLHRKPDSDGLRLYRSRIIDDGWSEQDVREALRKSPEFRELNTMTRQKAEDIVARAYHAVLNRDPDSGSRGYVDKVMRDRWTQGDVERELRKSPEYRNH